MHVSYVELFAHCTKVFRAYGIPNGCAEDGADVVTWSEFIGLEGMKTLLEEMTELNPSGMERINIIHEEEGLFIFDGNKQSALILGKLMADYALGAVESKDTVGVFIQNTTRSRLLAQPAYYIASRGRGCVIHYKTETGITRWILAAPEVDYPIFAEGNRAEEIMQENVIARLGKYETSRLDRHAFLLICTTDTTLITSCIRKLRLEAQHPWLQLTESAQLKAAFEKAFYHGASVDKEVWSKLDNIGRKTLVEATEESRRRGAG